jgi:hypothetical protein
MDLHPEPGPRIAPSVRGGAILVSLYSWTCVTIGVAIARFIIGRIHRVAFGLDDVTILCASVSCCCAFLSSSLTTSTR